MKEFERRTPKDRRQRLTPPWSWFIFFGRRRFFRRQSDQERGGNIDRYSPSLFFILVLILGLNIIDSILTMRIMDSGGREFNPVVRSVMDLHGDLFWIWKFAIVSVSLILLWLHRGYKLFRGIIIAIGSVYFLVVLYQAFLVTHFTPFRR